MWILATEDMLLKYYAGPAFVGIVVGLLGSGLGHWFALKRAKADAISVVRRQWMENFRSEVTEFLGVYEKVTLLIKTTSPAPEHVDDVKRLGQNFCSVRLYLDGKTPEHKEFEEKLVTAYDQVRDNAHKKKDGDSLDDALLVMNRIQDAIVEEARRVLDLELSKIS